MENVFKEDLLLKEKLLESGILIDSINDFIHTKESYPEAIPILIEFLSHTVDQIWWKEAIVRSLSTKEAKGIVNKPLLEEYVRTDKQKYSLYCWAIGNAFDIIIQPEDVDSILDIVKNKDNGSSRQMFVMASAKIKTRKKDIENTLIPLLDDNDITGHTLYTLGKLKSEKSREKIIPFLSHPNSYYKRSAKNALKKIDKE